MISHTLYSACVPSLATPPFLAHSRLEYILKLVPVCTESRIDVESRIVLNWEAILNRTMAPIIELMRSQEIHILGVQLAHKPLGFFMNIGECHTDQRWRGRSPWTPWWRARPPTRPGTRRRPWRSPAAPAPCRTPTCGSCPRCTPAPRAQTATGARKTNIRIKKTSQQRLKPSRQSRRPLTGILFDACESWKYVVVIIQFASCIWW